MSLSMCWYTAVPKSSLDGIGMAFHVGVWFCFILGLDRNRKGAGAHQTPQLLTRADVSLNAVLR